MCEKKALLIVGGAGYIGSHMAHLATDTGYRVVVLDNLSTGHADAVAPGALIVGDLADTGLLRQLFDSQRFAGVLHFAAHSQVGESVSDPAKYYRNNVANTQNLLDAMRRHEVGHCIFSSTAAIFGEPRHARIDEHHPTRPINPYGRSKQMVEHMLADYDAAYGLRYSCLRYFNAAGADPAGRLGERHAPETHLIPLVLQAASGTREAITVFGQDYPTPDGTCIRDYVHVMDLCRAHLLALERLWAGEASRAYNLGNGAGFSVREVIDTARRVTGQAIAERAGARRAGDPARLVADAGRAHEELGWRPQHGALEQIIGDAWRWQTTQAQQPA